MSEAIAPTPKLPVECETCGAAFTGFRDLKFLCLPCIEAYAMGFEAARHHRPAQPPRSLTLACQTAWSRGHEHGKHTDAPQPWPR